MLTKLISHEWKDTFKVPALLLTITVLLSAASLVYFSVADQASAGTDLNVRNFVLYIAYILILSGLSMILTIYFAIRFYKNLYTDEGYLMFTLPVKAHSHITSKGIVAFVWYLASFVVCALSIFILVVDQNVIDGLSQFFTVELPRYFQLAGGDGIAILFEVLALFLLSFVSGILMIYCSIALGSLFHNHKILGAFGMYLAINFVMQIIGTVGILVVFASSNDAALWSTMDSIRLVSTVVLPLCIAYYAVFSVVFYWVTNFIFKKKLNLE